MAAAPIVHGSEAEADAGFGGMVGETAADLAVVADADPGPAGTWGQGCPAVLGISARDSEAQSFAPCGGRQTSAPVPLDREKHGGLVKGGASLDGGSPDRPWFRS